VLSRTKHFKSFYKRKLYFVETLYYYFGVSTNNDQTIMANLFTWSKP